MSHKLIVCDGILLLSYWQHGMTLLALCWHIMYYHFAYHLNLVRDVILILSDWQNGTTLLAL
jgi:hypothetical protein